ncbi:MAG: PhoP regulatory network protein YrbL [Desulfuromonadaceae bacterium]|nr:PhoP regulatory network protein YrbL [Desulfuromonadaceae bacterium]
MLKLDKSDFVGKGLHRECYRHPENNALCVKVVVAGNDDETRREKKYYRHLEKRNISWEMIPEYHGDVETNLGTGSVFDLIVDHDGAVAKTLEYYLTSNKKTEAHSAELKQALVSLKEYLLAHRIITMTLKPKNIVFPLVDAVEPRLVVIDNIGNSDFIPVCNYSDFFARKKILRKWQKFEESMLNDYPSNTALQQMLSTVRC